MVQHELVQRQNLVWILENHWNHVGHGVPDVEPIFAELVGELTSVMLALLYSFRLTLDDLECLHRRSRVLGRKRSTKD